MNLEQRLLIKNYLDILLRRKRLIITCLLVAAAIGLGQYLSKPKIYSCSALIKYQRQSVNPTRMSPDDNITRTRDAVNTVSQQVMSRTGLEDIIQKFDLYPEMRNASIPMEKIVKNMRENHIKSRFLEGGDVFEVSYEGQDQSLVMKVTNALAEKFIEENLKYRQAQASQTSNYVHDELNMAKESLDEKETIMRDYKLQYYNEMPEQLTNNTNRLNALQEQYQNNQKSHLELERTRLQVQGKVSERVEFLSQLSSKSIAGPLSSTAPVGELNDINQVRLKLKSLQPRYTDKHPEVKRLKMILHDLESQQTISTETGIAQEVDPQLKELRQQLKDLEFNINRLNIERQELESRIIQYEKWIAAAPIREAEWSALTRDYNQLNDHYQRLVTQSIQAESAQTLEVQQKGSQFKIIDPAHYPEKPFNPNFMKIMIKFLGLGIIVGAGLSLGLELLNTSFKDPVDLEVYLGVPVVCALPIVYTKRELFKKRILNFAINFTLVLTAGTILSTAVYFFQQGTIIL